MPEAKELSHCCKAPIITDCYGDPSVPGCSLYFQACSKCGEHQGRIARYDVEKLRAALAVIKEFNGLDLADVDLFENGERIPVTAECLDEWRVIGMSNVGFVEWEFWKPENRPQPEKSK